LAALFGEVWLPEEVKREVISGSHFDGEAAIHEEMKQGNLKIRPQPAKDYPLPDLDEGEAACIRIAIAHPGDALILMDERAGRAIAAELGLKVAGTAAIIGMAKSQGLIGSARKVFEVLHGSDFRISASVIQAVLARVGEA
jgi:predicted nucleic acid-binding protein